MTLVLVQPSLRGTKPVDIAQVEAVPRVEPLMLSSPTSYTKLLTALRLTDAI
jgi:hypothetical protein